MIWIDSENVRHLPTPFGGDYSFECSMKTENIAISLGMHKTAKLGVSAAPAIGKKEAGG